VLKSDEFAKSENDPKARREIIGNSIYETVEKLVGSESAPKITGMIIDLNMLELLPTCSTLENLTVKVKDAFAMLQQIKAMQGAQQ
jgi:hypothetical protein